MRRAHCVYSDLPANRVAHPPAGPTGLSSDVDASARSSTVANHNQRVTDRVFDGETARRAVVDPPRELPRFDPTVNNAVTENATPVSSDPSISQWPIGSCKESSTSFLQDHLASFWADRASIGRDPIVSGNDLTEDDVTTPLPFIPGSGRQSFVSLEEQLPDKASASVWLNTFLKGPNMLFRICDEADSWRLLDTVYGKDHVDETQKCSIWLQLATGCRFTTGTAEETYTKLYDSGCQYLEWCIEQADEVAPLWVLPSMLLECLYFLDSKPKTCWLTLSSAIRLAQVHNLDQEKGSLPGLSGEEYERWRQVWRAIIFFDAWLSMTLGKTPQINQKTTQDPFVNMTLEEFAAPNPDIEVNVAKLSVLISRFLSGLSQGSMYPSIQEAFFHALEVWASNLPQNLRHFPDITAPQSSQADEAGSLYLEAFYFSSVTVLTKPEFFLSLFAAKPQSSRIGIFAQTCVDSSAQIGHLSSRILERGLLCKRSWLVATLAYHAGLVLCLSLSVQVTSLRYNLKPPGSHRVESDGLTAVMNVLSTCTSHSTLANHHHEVLRYFWKLIKNYEEAAYPTPPSWPDSTVTPRGSMSFGMWQTSPDPLPSTSSALSSSSYDFTAGSDYSFPTASEISQSAAARYHSQGMPDPSLLPWAGSMPHYDSSQSSNMNLESRQTSVNYGSGHYKPYMENFWSTETIEFDR
ncbi:hypothetical protein PV08_11068 [Exophiala spinifera]|uniref:Xylanolytic transcriptional activator regulatory domain-containing protein n=1 Tax=Exophiala spinifera TaxID=91928 RepID=A0A0D2ATQ6_9EURO|nr:uncharacterized protein PV08_11068 [Exophiala spinifera]KIW10108.1 hypothetical protein PV08_11068 [Exophiala spinifera]